MFLRIFTFQCLKPLFFTKITPLDRLTLRFVFIEGIIITVAKIIRKPQEEQSELLWIPDRYSEFYLGGVAS